MSSITLYPTSNFTFGTKEAEPQSETSATERLNVLRSYYETSGMRRAVDAVFLVHEAKHPHVLLLQIGHKFFKLPGGYLKPGEDEIEGLQKRLNELFGRTGADGSSSTLFDWNVGECIGTWWRPNFDNYTYPYLAPHVSRPKEQKKIFLVHLPEHRELSVPANLQLVAVPLLEFYNNPATYGAQLAGLPACLSRFSYSFAD
ncbi:hypothetical protein IWQ61_000437 [Dispira simplex]|nr:hypothetical protein IWQ61_000437 [Dispira simplex]